MELFLRLLRMKAFPFITPEGKPEEVSVNKTAALIGGELLAEGHQSSLVPLDNRLQIIDHEKRTKAFILKRRLRSIAETESTDDHIHRHFPGKLFPRFRESEIRKRNLHRGEEARHKILFSKNDLMNPLIVERNDRAAAKDQFTKRSRSEVEFFELRSGMHRVLYAQIPGIA